MDCREARERLSEYRDGSLPAPEAEAVSGHLSACAECASVAGSLDAVRERLRELAPDYAPPELLARVRASVRAEAGGTAGAAGSRAAGSRSFFSRRRLPLEAAAAVLLFASVYWYQKSSPTTPAPAPSAPSAVESRAPLASEKGAPDAARPRETADRRVAGGSRAPAGEGVRFVPENTMGAGSLVAAKEEATPAPPAKTRSWSSADLPAAPAVRASTDSGRIVPAQSPAAEMEKSMREVQGEGRVYAAPPSRLLRPVPYGREVVLEVSLGNREGMEERIVSAARRLGGRAEPSDRTSAGAPDGAAAVRVLLPEPSAAAFLEELGRLGTIPPEGMPAAVDTPAGPRAGTVAYSVRIRVR